jgi:hypothetical protein
LACAAAVEFTLALAFSVPAGSNLHFEHFFGFIYFASILVIPGWVVALPLIVIPEKTTYLPTLKALTIGTLIGPCIMLAIGIYAAIANGTGLNYKIEAWYLVVLALVVSFLTTALYLTSLKLLTRNRIQHPS